ncbi:MAG: ABC transporter ATP-binding protein/permease [Prevotella sp.]|nr:ABC transporter ATP-binding protein/permease [Prevotella sp.]
MRKMREYHFQRGLAKDLLVATFFFSLQEILNTVYPLVLKNLVTEKIENDTGMLPSMGNFLISAGIVLGLLVIIFFVSFYARNRVSVYGAKCRRNARNLLYDKMTRVPTNVLYEYGTSKFLSSMMEDTTWVKYRHEQFLQAAIYFVVTILGSCVLIMTLSPIYVLFIVAAVAVEIGILMVHRAIISKRMPAAVDAYDKSFVATRESIAGARDIRILGKQSERSATAARQNKALAREVFDIDQSKHIFECSNNIVFGIVTFGIILFGALSYDGVHLAEQLVIINTILQYITLCTTATLNIFKLLINPMTRGRVAYARIDQFMHLPEEDIDQGLTKLDTEFGSSLVLYQVSHRFWNGRKTIEDLSMELQKGKMVAFCGEVGAGRTTLIKILLRYFDPTTGMVLVNGINIKDFNKRFYRAKIISYCPAYPEFLSGTVRENIRLFNPEVTDEQILAAFNEIGAANLAILPSFLDTPLSVRAQLPQDVKSLINVVRCILKPAEFYVFDGSFINLSNDVVQSTLHKLRAENKACVFTTINPLICESADEVFFAQSDHHYVKGTHTSLLAENQEYAAFFMKAEQLEAQG